jgi:hypothetical protein
MSTVTVQTISNGTVSTSSANVIQGSAKAWVNFNGTTGGIFSSHNVSSVTVVTTGTFTVNFTTAMPNTNYCFSSGGEYYPAANALIVATAWARSTTSISVNVNYTNTVVFNTDRVNVVIHSS